MTRFSIIDTTTNIEIAYAYNLIDAIGNKEYFENKGYKNLEIVRIKKD